MEFGQLRRPQSAEVACRSGDEMRTRSDFFFFFLGPYKSCGNRTWVDALSLHSHRSPAPRGCEIGIRFDQGTAISVRA